jgi:hypothetical protein
VVTVVVMPVLLFLTVTVAPLTTEPEGSVTVPRMLPVETCAFQIALPRVRINSASSPQKVKRSVLFILFSLVTA